MVGLTDFTDDVEDSEELHLMNIEYEEEFGTPITHLFCRDDDGNFTWVEVEGHDPSFYIHENAFSERLVNHEWVTGVDGGHRSIRGEPLVKITTKLPKHIGGTDDSKGLRDYFEQTWEADVFYTTRFLLDTGIKTHLRVQTDASYEAERGDYRVRVDDIEPVEDPSWRVTPRVCTVDIEVLSPDGFPEPKDANQPVTAITAHDNYDDAYYVWVRRAETWDHSDNEIENLAVDVKPDSVAVANVSVFDDEADLLYDFNQWVDQQRPDLLSGWNSSTTDNGYPFDYPYLINRSKHLNVFNHDGWSPMGQIWNSNWGPSGKGVGFFDMLKGYKKTQWQKPKGGYTLENISDKECDIGKLAIDDIDVAWRDDPATFLTYNMRDVKATVGINDNAGVMELFQNIRKLTGVQFDNCHNNIDLLDSFILRYAQDLGVALPTNEKPSRGWYYGAEVFESEPGLHPNVIYPDLWSMYPNMIRNVNMSPETIVGTKADLDDSEYTEDDCRWTYVDTRPTNVKNPDNADNPDPQYEKLYFLKPSVKKGFMTEVVDDLMGLKDHYDGTPLYDAVKRIVNSVYGVYGDSDSYGKGYRLFDWRIAEGITLGGRKMITDSSDKFIDAVNEIKDERDLDGQNAYLVGGDTDSVMTAIPFIDGDERSEQETILDIAHEAADRVNEWYEQWTADTFNLTDGDHYCELEIESYSKRTFVPRGKTSKKVKKRYAEIMAWEEGEWFDPPTFSITGIDVVRSDRAVVTRETIETVLNQVLRTENTGEARKKVYDTISETVDDINNGNIPLSDIARPKGMGQPPEQYGTSQRRPQPTYRGAKYANKFFEWEQLGEGSQPKLLYIDTVRGDWPRTYSAETAEDNDTVDAIAVEHPDKLPDEIVVDTETMIDKTLRDPLTPILESMHWDFEEAIADSSQGELSEFM